MRLGITLAVVLMLLGLTETASAAPPLGPDGETAPTYDYLAATRERVFIPQPGIDQDHNGVADKITIDIIRPSESSATNTIPAIIDPSPYFTSLCRGLRSECMGDMDADGVNDLWPLFLDNYFVPRGYAVILGQMNGTGYTTDGCPYHGGPGDIAGEKSIIDWLNGRTAGVDKNGNPVLASWHNGKAAMIGKSYDGTLANGDKTAVRLEGFDLVENQRRHKRVLVGDRPGGQMRDGLKRPARRKGSEHLFAQRFPDHVIVSGGARPIHAPGTQSGDTTMPKIP